MNFIKSQIRVWRHLFREGYWLDIVLRVGLFVMPILLVLFLLF